MNTDLDLYRIFCIVVKQKNISKAARSMYISQSAITQSIQKLEGYLGFKVFYRNKNGVELTEEGENLYEYVKDSIEIIDKADDIFSKYSNLEKGTIRIGGDSDLLTSFVFEPILRFIKKYPEININIKNVNTDIIMQELANGKFHIVALNLSYNIKKYTNVDIIPLKKSSNCFFASKKYLKDNPINNYNEIKNRMIILQKSSMQKKQTLRELSNKKENLLNSYVIENTSILKKLVLNNIGIGYANKECLVDIKNEIEIIKETEEIEIGIATLNRDMANKPTRELIEEIKKYYKEN